MVRTNNHYQDFYAFYRYLEPDLKLIHFLKYRCSGLFSYRFTPVVLALMIAGLSPALSAKDVMWVTVTGTAPILNHDKKKAKSLAMEDAMKKALKKAISSNISTENLLVNLKLSGSITGAIPYGKVVKTETLEETEDQAVQSGQSTSSPVYKVRINAAVTETSSGSDPKFRIRATLNQSNFLDGDEMTISIKPTMDCYSFVFILLEDNKVLRLIPNLLMRDNFLKAEKSFVFPDEIHKRNGVQLKVSTPEDKQSVTEAVYILALKQPVDLGSVNIQEGVFGLYDGRTAFMKDLINKIVSIPLSDRAEELIQYHIQKESTGKSG